MKVTPKVMLRECLEGVAFLDMVRSVESGQNYPKIAMICEQAIEVMVLVSGVISSQDRLRPHFRWSC